MRRCTFTLTLLFSLLALTASSMAASNPDLAMRGAAEQVAAFQMGDEQALNKARTLLDEVIVAHPDHHGLLKSRGQVLAMAGNGWAVLADFDRAIAAPGGDYPDIRLFRCLLLESLQVAGKELMACYEQVCDAYANKNEPLPTDYLNWAMAEQLAGHQEKAEELVERARAYPELMADEVWNMLAPGGVFDRRALVQGLFPGKSE